MADDPNEVAARRVAVRDQWAAINGMRNEAGGFDPKLLQRFDAVAEKVGAFWLLVKARSLLAGAFGSPGDPDRPCTAEHAAMLQALQTAINEVSVIEQRMTIRRERRAPRGKDADDVALLVAIEQGSTSERLAENTNVAPRTMRDWQQAAREELEQRIAEAESARPIIVARLHEEQARNSTAFARLEPERSELQIRKVQLELDAQRLTRLTFPGGEPGLGVLDALAETVPDAQRIRDMNAEVAGISERLGEIEMVLRYFGGNVMADLLRLRELDARLDEDRQALAQLRTRPHFGH